MDVTRRRLLSLAGAGAMVGGLAACRTSSDDPGTAEGSDSAGTAAVMPTASHAWPVDYDFAPSEDGVIPAFMFGYPDNPPQTVSTPPGQGGTVTAACQINTPIPAAMDRNPAWQAINEGLNVTLDIQYTPGAEWPAKLQSILAGGDLPDITQVTEVPRLPDLLPRRFADLTEYLAGDAVADYPNLALLGDAAWRSVIHHGSIWGIPQPRARSGGAPLRVRSDITDSLGLELQPADGEELIELLRAAADPQQNRWATAAVGEMVTAFADMLGAPNGWRLDGGLVMEYESEEYLEALNQAAVLWDDGVFHPDAFGSGKPVGQFDSGQAVLQYGSFDPGVRYTLNRPGNPDYAIDFLVLPKWDGGGATAGRLSSGYYGMGSLKQDLEPDRITELLGILNYLAAPNGTAEALICKYGVEGRHYTIEDGIINVTEHAAAEVMVTGYLAFPPTVYVPTQASLVEVYRALHDRMVDQYVETNDNPTFGHYSETDDEQGGEWESRFEDARNNVIQGRMPVTEFQSLVEEWRTTIGDKVRGEYEAALEEA